MRFPSIDQLIADGAASVRRFPFVILAAVISALLPMSGMDGLTDSLGTLIPSGTGEDLVVASTLAIPLFFALRLAQERGLFSASFGIAVRLACVAGLLAVVWQWAGWGEQTRVIRYAQLSLGAHLLAAFLPYVGRDELNGFWQYNRTLFLRFLIAGIYSGVLYAGLAVAIVALRQLFGINFADEVFFDLWLAIAFVFSAWLFVAGAPRDVDGLDSLDDYPRGLKVFAQFVLIPLVTIYLAILTAYFLKVVITTQWPSGWIGWLVSSVSVVGILSILLTHPIRDRTENRWIASYGRWFWIVMMPAILMLLIATWKRISQYGITEPRYFLVVLTLWLAGMAVYYGIVRSQNIKILPLSLCIVALLTFGGPWSAYSVSRNSQTDRFVGLLESNGMLEEGRAVAASAEVGLDDRRELSGSLTYLLAAHGTAHLTDLLGADLAVTDSMGGQGPLGNWKAGERASAILGELGIEYVSARRADGTYFQFQADPGERIAVEGYDFVFKTRTGNDWIAWEEGDSLQVALIEDEARLELRNAGGEVLVELPLGEMLDRAREADLAKGFDRTLPRDVLRADGAGRGLGVTLYIDTVNGQWMDEGVRVNSLFANWLVAVMEDDASVTE